MLVAKLGSCSSNPVRVFMLIALDSGIYYWTVLLSASSVVCCTHAFVARLSLCVCVFNSGLRPGVWHIYIVLGIDNEVHLNDRLNRGPSIWVMELADELTFNHFSSNPVIFD